MANNSILTDYNYNLSKVISPDIVQINLKTLKDGTKKLSEIFPDQNKPKEKTKKEVPKEQPKEEVAEQPKEQPKEEPKTEAKPEEKKEE